MTGSSLEIKALPPPPFYSVGSVSNPLLYSLGRQYGDLEKSGLDELHLGMSLRAWWKEGGTVSVAIPSVVVIVVITFILDLGLVLPTSS